MPLTALVRADRLGEAGYHRVLSVALLLFALAAAGWALARPYAAPRARFGGWAVAAGLALACIGTAIEFWGMLIGPPPEGAIGFFNFGFLLLLVGGPTLAVGLRREEEEDAPWWLLVHVTLLGFGVLLGTVLNDASLPAALVGIGLFAAGWLGVAWHLAAPPRLAAPRDDTL